MDSRNLYFEAGKEWLSQEISRHRRSVDNSH